MQSELGKGRKFYFIDTHYVPHKMPRSTTYVFILNSNIFECDNDKLYLVPHGMASDAAVPH